MRKSIRSLPAILGGQKRRSTPLKLKSSKLRCEELENRALLSATISDAALFSPGAILYMEATRFIEDCVVAEEASEAPDVAPIPLQDLAQPEADAACDELLAEALALEIVEVSETTLELDGETNDSFFDEHGVYIDGRKYVPLTVLKYRPKRSNVGEFSPVLSELLDGRGALSGGGSGGGQGIDLALGIDYVRALGSPTNVFAVYGESPTGGDPINIAISEGQSPGSEIQTFDDLRAGDYMRVKIPALPYNYMSVVSFGGSAILGQDYVAYVDYSESPSDSASGTIGFDHSGGSTYVYLFPLENAVKGPTKTATLIFGEPSFIGSGGGDSLDFDGFPLLATAAITDNDNWKIELEPAFVVEDDIVIAESGDNTEANFVVKRVDAGDGRSGDLHYSITVVIDVDGTASASDYEIRRYNVDGTHTTLAVTDDQFTVVIPAGAVSTTFTIKGVADNLVERLFETLEMTLSSATCSSNSFVVDTSPIEVKIKDCDSLQLEAVQFKNNLDIVSDTEATFGTHWGNATHWDREDSSKTKPIGYVCDHKMKCEAIVSGDVDPNVDVYVRVRWTYTNSNGEIDYEYSGWEALTSAIVTTEIDKNFKTIFEQRQAYYDPYSKLDWEFAVNVCPEEEERIFGQNTNPLYVTYKTPGTGYILYHTIIHTGCLAANGINGETSETDVFVGIWGAFESKMIQKVKMENGVVVNDGVLSYYGKVSNAQQYSSFASALPATKTSTGYEEEEELSKARVYSNSPYYNPQMDSSFLLRFKDGKCDAWACFAQQVYNTQGISVVLSEVKWNISEFRIAVSSNNVVVLDPVTNGTAMIPVAALKIRPEVLGQGHVAPLEFIWPDHALIKYNNTVYDPSYGTVYGGSSSEAKQSFLALVDSFGELRNRAVYNEPTQKVYVYDPLRPIKDDLGAFIDLDDLIASFDFE